MPKFLAPIDLQQNELQNARLQNLAVAPGNAKIGQVYHDTTNNRTYICVQEGPDAKWIDATVANKGTLDGVTIIGSPKVKSDVRKANGSANDRAFHVEDVDGMPLFEVMTNGDAVVAGVLKVSGGVQGGEGSGIDFSADATFDGNLTVKGSTFLGDNPAEDIVVIKGKTSVQSKSEKDLWETEETEDEAGSISRSYTYDGAPASEPPSAFEIVDSTGSSELFKVLENGDTVIGGILRVNGNGTSEFAGDVKIGGNLTVIGNATVKGIMEGQDFRITGNLIVEGNTELGNDPYEDKTDIKGQTTVHAKGDLSLWQRIETKDADGNVTDVAYEYDGQAQTPEQAFSIKDTQGVPLFEVLENGDTIIAGVLKVNGDGTSEFAGDVKIGGNLTVVGNATVKGIMEGQDFRIAGNLVVDGNTTLGNDAGEDSTTIHGKTTIHSGKTKAQGSSSQNAFEVVDSNESPLFEVRENGDARIAGTLTVSGGTGEAGDTGGVSTEGDHEVMGDLHVRGNSFLGDNAAEDKTVIKGQTSVESKSDSTKWVTREEIDGNGELVRYYSYDGGPETTEAPEAAFFVEDSEENKIFQVLENGDTVIAGILRVNGNGTSEFAGDVRIGGNLTVVGNATVKGIMEGEDFRITGNLIVEGNTELGNEITDETTIMGRTRVISTDKDLDLWERDESDVNNPTFTYNGAPANPETLFSIESTVGQRRDLFKVLDNGDTEIAGVLTVTGKGTSKFAGDVLIGGNLTVEKNATVKGVMSGNDMTIEGNLIVEGNTTLGDDAKQDSTTINGMTTINTGGKKGDSGASNTSVFKIQDNDESPLFDVRQNGDTVIAGSLTVSGDISSGGSGASEMAGDFVVDGDLLVRGNTTLGDNVGEDEITINGHVDMTGHRIENLEDPIEPQDAATKAYVDGVATGLDIKDSVRVATSENISLGAQDPREISGVTLVEGDRVLVKAQTDRTENGIYEMKADGSLIRAYDADNHPGREVSSGMFTFVEEGQYADSGWVLSTENPIELGETELTFTQFSGAGSFESGKGLTRDGNRIDVVGTPGRISVTNDGVDIDENYTGQSSISTVGTITTGVWNGTAIGVEYGGTGASTPEGVRANLGLVGKYSSTIGDGVATTYEVTHGLGTNELAVSIYDTTDGSMVLADVMVDEVKVTINLGAAPDNDRYRVVVIG